MIRTPKATVEAYFAGWINRDFDALGEILAEDVDFVGSMGKVRGRAGCVQGLAGVRQMIDGIRVVDRWADGPDVITWFELLRDGAEPIPVTNWSHIEEGLVTRIRVTFDPRPLLGS
jgi:hypothetical protein